MTPIKARAALAAAATTPPAPRRRVAGARRRPGGDTVIELPDTALPDTALPDTALPDTDRRGPGRDAEPEPEPEPVPDLVETDISQAVLAPSQSEILSSTDAPADVPGEDDTKSRPRRRRTPAVVPAVLSFCLVAVLAACLLAALTTRHDRDEVAAGDAAVAAARTSAATILSYDYRHLDSDFAAATALTTGSFRSDYQATTTKAVSQLATQTKAVVVAKVAAVGVVSSSTDRATLLLFVDQTTTSNRLSSAKTDLVRVQMTMSRVGGRWLVSSLKAL
jgi:Mce-associated membrane protein